LLTEIPIKWDGEEISPYPIEEDKEQGIKRQKDNLTS